MINKYTYLKDIKVIDYDEDRILIKRKKKYDIDKIYKYLDDHNVNNYLKPFEITDRELYFNYLDKRELELNTNNKQVMDSIFSAFANTDETYSTYSVYILREDDNLEEVMAKYNTNREALSEYNDLDNLKVGAKLIIPTMVEVSDK